MSVEKLDFNYIKQAQKSFTTLLNEVLQNIPDGLVLGIYCYLSSLPHDWIINKQHLMNHFHIGRDKVGRILKWLNDHKLLAYERERLPDGTLGAGYIVIKDGQDFVQSIKKNPRPIRAEDVRTRLPESSSLDGSTRLPEIQSLDNPESGESATTNKISFTKETKSTNSPTGVERFNDFWISYPRKQKKKDAERVWKKMNCNSMADKIIKAVIQKKQSDVQWQNSQYIPLPASFLNGERWNDEIIVAKPIVQTKSISPFQPQQTHSYGSMRDFTQERLDREQGIVRHEQNIIGDRPRGEGVRKAQDYFLPR